MKRVKTLFATLLLLGVSLPALADDVTYSSITSAAQNTSDLSRQALVTIFGDVVTSPFSTTDTTVIGSLFGILNGVLCAVALFWFLTVTLKGIVKSGSEGKVFGNARTMLAPVMSFLGFISLVPTASGWSLSQLVMLWAASIMGVGSANLLTDKAVDMMSDGYSLVTQPTSPDTRSAARQIFEMDLCKYAVNAQLQTLYNDSGSASTESMSTTSSDGSYVTGNGSAICGTASIPTTTRSSSWSVLFDSDVDTSSIVEAQKTALATMQSTLDSAASSFVTSFVSKRDDGTGSLSDVETIIQNAASSYETKISSAVNSLSYESSLQSSLTSNMKTYGWASLGAWYQTFATANAKTNDVAASAPKTSGPTGVGELGSGELYQEVFAAYKAQLQNSTYTPTLGTQSAADDIKSGTTTDPKSVFVGLFNSPMQQITNGIATMNIGQENSTSDQVNPLLQMKKIGDYTLDGVGAALTTYVGIQLTTAWTGNNIVGRITDGLTGWKAAIVAVLQAVSPPFYFLLLIMFSVGFSLAVLLPAIPFICWMTGFINWIVSVLVGCAAGPMWAATHLGAEEDKGSRAAYGYVFLIDMMLRPSLMVLGFFFASVTVVAGGTVLNLLFASAMANAQVDSMTGLFIALGWLLVYSRICTHAVTKLFGLVVTLPDYVISFLGGRDGANLMGGMVEATNNIIAGFGGGARKTPGMNAQERNTTGDKDGLK
ncbi:DotA/TraY family protein [Rouxiella badensis]|jgi:conjugal transfer/type IV secretion protein DotA/TraY|uniref:DotA/TraY family protein n=1 Tax=Rouxiella badensis TaxID=1646377 RepID=UPI00178830D3|nr:DotA/TraY family protein [Rouxiella badensis]QOI58015.1 DotA/TraY family protein [Rouxiella badensis subsp. acadiensis]